MQAETVLVEVLDGDGAPCPPGAVGRMVITPPHNFAAPLIRYKIGDYAEAGGPRPCGPGLPVIARVLGRRRDMVTLSSGERRFVLLDCEALGRVAPLCQIQMVQRRPDEVEVNLVATRNLNRAEIMRLRDALVDGLGHPFALRINYVGAIPRAASGTFKDFSSEI